MHFPSLCRRGLPGVTRRCRGGRRDHLSCDLGYSTLLRERFSALPNECLIHREPPLRCQHAAPTPCRPSRYWGMHGTEFGNHHPPDRGCIRSARQVLVLCHRNRSPPVYLEHPERFPAGIDRVGIDARSSPRCRLRREHRPPPERLAADDIVMQFRAVKALRPHCPSPSVNCISSVPQQGFRWCRSDPVSFRTRTTPRPPRRHRCTPPRRETTFTCPQTVPTEPARRERGYSSEVKRSVLHVLDGPIVSEEAARIMARHGYFDGATLALAVTGEAGPHLQEDVPLGTVWFRNCQSPGIRCEASRARISVGDAPVTSVQETTTPIQSGLPRPHLCPKVVYPLC